MIEPMFNPGDEIAIKVTISEVVLKPEGSYYTIALGHGIIGAFSRADLANLLVKGDKDESK